MAKLLIIGPSLSGKTSLVKSLRKNTNYIVAEIDEWLTDLNGGEFPKDDEYKNTVLAKKVFSRLLKTNDIIFFSNAWYFNNNQLKQLKNIGFKVVFLKSNLNTLKERNSERVKIGYENMEKYLEDMLLYGEEIKEYTEFVLDTELPIEEIVKDIKVLYNN